MVIALHVEQVLPNVPCSEVFGVSKLWTSNFPGPEYKYRSSTVLHHKRFNHIAVKLIHLLKERRTKTEMQSTKEKLSNMASAAKEHIDIYKAKIDEKAEKATARTEEEKVIAHERAKAKEAQAKMELHEAKARHAAEKLSTKQQPYHLVGAHQHGMMNQPGYGAAPVPKNSYPVAGHYPVNKHI